MYKVTVIIPTYNSERFIEKTVDSVVNQSLGFENIELIISDDNSSDNTKSILEKLENKYDNIKCIYHSDNSGGPSRGRNEGLDIASSEYVMFLDHDDLYDEFICERLYDSIVKYDVNIAMCNHNFTDLGVNPSFEDVFSDENGIVLLDPKKNRTMIKEIEMWNKIFKISFLKEFDIYCPVGCFAEDLFFVFKSFLNCDKMVFIKDYYGYNHIFRISEGDYSTGTFRSFKHLMMLLKGFEETFKIDGDNKEALDLLMDHHSVNIIFNFVNADLTEYEQFKFMEELYIFQEEYGWFSLKELFARVINNNIKKRNFKRALFLINFMKFIEQSEFITKLYHKFHKH